MGGKESKDAPFEFSNPNIGSGTQYPSLDSQQDTTDPFGSPMTQASKPKATASAPSQQHQASKPAAKQLPRMWVLFISLFRRQNDSIFHSILLVLSVLCLCLLLGNRFPLTKVRSLFIRIWICSLLVTENRFSPVLSRQSFFPLLHFNDFSELVFFCSNDSCDVCRTQGYRSHASGSFEPNLWVMMANMCSYYSILIVPSLGFLFIFDCMRAT